MQNSDFDYLVVGRIGGAYGIKGWVKVQCYTEPVTNILNYSPWYMRHKSAWQELNVENTKLHSGAIIAQFEGIVDRNQALAIRGLEIAVNRDQLPVLEAGEYYWHDLIGLAVKTVQDEDLGLVVNLMATGANDVLVIKGDRERLIPFIREQVIKKIDLADRLIVVDWDADF